MNISNYFLYFKKFKNILVYFSYKITDKNLLFYYHYLFEGRNNVKLEKILKHNYRGILFSKYG